MRKPDTIERLYLDFDGFFASVEQQARPALRGKPVGIVPFDGTVHTVVIACSKEAKARGVKNVMRLGDAKKICPELILQCQSPDLYRRAHNALLAEINSVLPIEAVKSIDELCCVLDKKDIADPEGVAAKIKMEKRLFKAGIYNMKDLLATQPKQMRKLWGNVTGERLWYALHGYEVQAQKSERGMFGHGRVLPPELRNFKDARDCSRLLLVKAARRMRRERYYAGTLYMWLSLRLSGQKEAGWSTKHKLHMANGDQAVLKALDVLWTEARDKLRRDVKIVRVGVTLGELTTSNSRQLDMLINDDCQRAKWESVTTAMDGLNSRYGKSLVTMGPWKLPPGGNLGGKISFTRIPRAEDFW